MAKFAPVTYVWVFSAACFPGSLEWTFRREGLGVAFGAYFLYAFDKGLRGGLGLNAGLERLEKRLGALP